MVIGGDAWDSLLAVAGRADLIGDERYATDGFRADRPDEVGEIISAWTKTLTKNDVMKTLSELGIPCSAVRDTAELMTDPHLRAREMMVEVSDSVRGDFTAIGCPIKIDGNAIEVTTPPLLSEHTDEVLGEVLGIDATDAAVLREQGAV
jgi:crotonobetainyl-CoA:carnitine CoA-transferase CaiB-like acyl-CoA transferase